jgi:hypothetical protein
VSRLAYRCDRVQSQQVYFPQDGWRAIGRNAKELNPELRHRLGVHRYSSRGIQADRLARLAYDRQRDPVPLSRHRVGTGLMFAPARLGIGGRAEVKNSAFASTSTRLSLSRRRRSHDRISYPCTLWYNEPKNCARVRRFLRKELNK